MAKTREQLEKECQSTVKLVLIEMEQLASMEPKDAGEPYGFEQRRQRVVRKIWSLFKEALNHDAGKIQREERRQLGGDVPGR